MLQVIRDCLKNAIKNNSLHLEFQPQYTHEMMIGVEALVRLRCPMGEISPPIFIRQAEELGIMDDISCWVFRNACQRLRDWMDAELVPENFRMSINISPLQLKQSVFVSNILNTAKSIGVNNNQLTLEITESSLVDDVNIVKLHQLHAKGVRIAIDDFGTGYSSLARLKLLPIDEIKIDKMFVNDVTKSFKDVALVTAILDLAKALGVETVVEGVEDIEQHDVLAQIGFDTFQGFYFSRPLSTKELELLFKQLTQT